MNLHIHLFIFPLHFLPNVAFLAVVSTDNVIDFCPADKRSLEIVTRNVTLKDFVDVEEKCSYNPHPENEDWTLLRQETSITCQTSMPALKSMAEKIEQKCVEKFQHNSARGREVVEAVCKALERAESGAVTKAEPHLVVNPQQNSKTRSHGIKWRIFEAASLVGATL